MPHDRSALIDQLRAHLTKQRFVSVVIHDYCRSPEHFVDYLARRQIAVDAATPEHVSRYLRYAIREVPPASRPRTSAAVEIDMLGGNPRAVTPGAEAMASRGTASQLGRSLLSSPLSAICSEIRRRLADARVKPPGKCGGANLPHEPWPQREIRVSIPAREPDGIRLQALLRRDRRPARHHHNARRGEVAHGRAPA